MKTYTLYLIALALLLFTSCKDSSVDVHEEEEPLTATLTLSSDHVHTLSELSYTVTITDHHGETITDMQTVEVQRKAHEATEWRGTELALSGTNYTGTYTFNSSGEYEIRVAGIRSGGTDMEVMYEMTEHMHVVRAHLESGAYRIEYENFPGHVHEGEAATVKFFVFEAEKDANGDRPVVSGLTDVHIHCSNPDGTTEHHDTSVVEESPGVYVQDHTFMGGGEAMLSTHFTAPDQTEVEGEFHLHVAHGH